MNELETKLAELSEKCAEIKQPLYDAGRLIANKQVISGTELRKITSVDEEATNVRTIAWCNRGIAETKHETPQEPRLTHKKHVGVIRPSTK